MFEILSDFPENVLAVRGTGRITAEDYRDTLTPEALRRIERHGSLRLFCQLGPEFEGVTAGALWADTKLGLRHWGDFGRMAVVTDVGWIADAVRLFAPFFHHPARVFANADLAQAERWIAEPGE
jgi:SpoIIAA-like